MKGPGKERKGKAKGKYIYTPGGDGALCVVTCLMPRFLTSWNKDVMTSRGRNQPSKATPNVTLGLSLKGAVVASFFSALSANGAMKLGFKAKGDHESTRPVKQYP